MSSGKISLVTKKDSTTKEVSIVETIQKLEEKNEENLKTLETLLDKFKFKIPRVGELVKGIVIEIGKNSLYLDLGNLGTGLVMGREMKDGLGLVKELKPGDEVEATVVELENEDGYMELSLREAGYEKIWTELNRKKESGETVQTKILAANRGGLMVEINGITGFLPVSQLSSENYPRVEDGDKTKILQLLNNFINQTMGVRIIDVNKEEEKLIVSEKATFSEKEEEEVKKFKLGDEIEGIISGIVKFGAFVKFPPQGQEIKEGVNMLEGLVHISELAWQLIENPRDVVKMGEKVKCKIIALDRNKISLSMRALQKDPWSEIEQKYKIGDIIKGNITKVNPFGAFVQLDESIHGLAHISELNRYVAEKNGDLDDMVRDGKITQFKILSIEKIKHRMGLTPCLDRAINPERQPDSSKKEEQPSKKEDLKKTEDDEKGDNKDKSKEQKDNKATKKANPTKDKTSKKTTTVTNSKVVKLK